MGDFLPIEGGPLRNVGTGNSTGGSVDQGAYDALVQMLKQYDLQSLAGDVMKFLQDGYSQDQVSVLIQDTSQYKQRFAGNEKRRAAGIPALTPKDYLSVESAYRQILSTSGMPIGFYDQHSDFVDWIGRDVAPQEISTRVGLAVEAADKMDPNLAGVMSDWYGVGKNDLAAFFLDQHRALPLIQKMAKAAQLGNSYRASGLTTDKTRAEYLASQAGSRDLGTLAGQVGDLTQAGNRLSDIYGGLDYGQTEAESELFNNDAMARQRRQNLSGMEEAAFAGKSAIGNSSLTKPAQY